MVVRVHEGHCHGVLRVQSALVGVAAVHGVDHMRHFLPGGSDGVLTLLSELPVMGGGDGKRPAESAHSQMGFSNWHQLACRTLLAW